MEGVIALIVLGGLIVLIIFLVRYSKKINQKKIGWYQNWALKLGLKHELSKYMLTKLNVLSGQLDGNQVLIYEKIVGSGKNRSLYTFVEFTPNPFDFQFSIGKEGFFSKIGKSLGAKDIEFDNTEFDKTFLLKSKEEDKFRAMMDYRAQEALRGIENVLVNSIVSNQKTLSYSIFGGFTKEEKIEDFERVMDFMRLLIKNKR